MKRSFVSFALLLAAGVPAIPAERTPIAEHIFNSSAPYSPGILSGDTLYVSGLQGADPKSGEFPKDFAQEVRRCLDNVGLVLREAGMDFNNVVSVQLYVTDMTQFAKLNEIYREYFKQPYPARTTISVPALSLGARFEAAVIARR